MEHALPKLQDSLVIAVDFDGTIVDHAYPRIGKERTFAIETCKKLKADGHRLILWTYRSGERLEEAVDFCRERGLEFYAINRNYPEEQFIEGEVSRKVNADLFIDDRNLGGVLGWGEIYQMITAKKMYQPYTPETSYHEKTNSPKKSFLAKLLGA